MSGVGFEVCLPVRRASAAARQAGGTQTGNLIFRAKRARNCPPARQATSQTMSFGQVPFGSPIRILAGTGTYPPLPIRAGKL